MLTLVVWKVAIFPLEEEVPNADIRHVERGVRRVGGHVGDVLSRS